MEQKEASEADRYCGMRIRARRLESGMSQEALGIALGITFQQVQKYEKGRNRVSTGRLQEIARLLKVGPDYFMMAKPKLSRVEDAGARFLADANGTKIALAFAGIESSDVRRGVADLVVLLSGRA